MYSLYQRNAITPEGWLERQLRVQAAGLSGNLDKIWPDIRDSAWIGGDREGWERVPYWLDGFIPLAFLLRDEDMIARAKHYIDAILERQQPNGWICPCKAEQERRDYDLWALFLIGKVLALYCDFTGDERVEDALRRAMENAKALLNAGKIRLFDWGKFRWYECFIPLLHLYRRKPEDWILALARTLRAQGANYPDYVEAWKRPLNKWTQYTHIVNLSMMLKYEAVAAQLLGDAYENRAEELWQILERYNGTAVGCFTGDECLSGVGANHGTELCSVMELMYSCEVLYAVTEDDIWAERLEKLAFNAMPATFTDDMWAHQYDQQVNQIACQRLPGKSFFRTNGSESHLFGLEPNYGCCTANLSQGWPKLAMNTFLRAGDGVVCALMLPAALHTQIDGVNVRVSNRTAYPFRHEGVITVQTDAPVTFTLRVRIPRWAKHATLNGKTVRGRCVVIRKTWQGEESLTLALHDTPHLVRRPGNMRVAQWGALVFALPIEAEYRKLEYEKNGVERKYPYCDYELIPQSAWNYGFAGGEMTLEEHGVGDVPFSSRKPPVTLRAAFAPVAWDYADGYETIADAYPRSSRAMGEAVEMEMIPYGCAKLRMTEMPPVRK